MIFGNQGWLASATQGLTGVARIVPRLRREDRDRAKIAEAALEQARRTQARLLEALDQLPEGIVILDGEGRYVAWNAQYTSMYPGTADLMVIGEKLETAVRAGVARGEYPEAEGRQEEWLRERLARLSAPGGRYEQRLSDGRVILIEDRRIGSGGLVSLRVDITEMKQREASFQLMFEGNPLPMIVCRRGNWTISAVNDAAVRHYGFAREEFQRLEFGQIHCAVDCQRARSSLYYDVETTLNQGSFRHVRKDGCIIEVELRASAVVYEGEPSILIAVIDITDRRRSEQHVVHLARHDSLTGLPNRFQLTERMQAVFGEAGHGPSVAMLFVDLDKFKTVNDTLGHSVGDAVLKEVAKRLCRCVRNGDTVARLGGDEYAILLTQGCTRATAKEVCRRIQTEMQRPVLVDGREIHVGASIGVAMMPEDGMVPEDVLRCSDVAMYAAKQDGRGCYRFFEPELDERVKARGLIEAELHHAIAAGELEVHYQPLLSLTSDQVNCMEALVRWRHPKRGLVPPSEFIPIAEETGMIVDLGAFVLRRACLDAATWPSSIKLAVNVSALELNRPGFMDQLRDVLAQSTLPASRLQIEVTETAVMSDTENAIALLSAIRTLGVEVVMDDFGTGYSSLCSLRTFPFDRIKIDRAFIRDASVSSDGHDVLSAIVSLVHALGMSTTAEGVETAEQKAIVAALQCDEMQGFLCSPARPLADLWPLLLRAAVKPSEPAPETRHLSAAC